MLLDEVKEGTTDYSVEIRIVDSTDGTPETGVVFNTTGIDLWYRRPGSAHTSITEVTQTEGGAHTDGGFVHISDGVYRLDLPDAAVAAGADYVTIGGTVTGMIVIGGRVRIKANTEEDIYDRIGAPAGASVSADIATVDTNVDALPSAADVVNEWETQSQADPTGFHVNVLEVAGTAQTANDIGNDVNAILTDTGTTIPATLTTIEGKIDTVDSNVDAVLVDTGTTIPGTLTTIDTNVDAILVDTGTTIPGTLTTIDNEIAVIDGIVDDILVDTSTTIPASLTTIDNEIATIDANVDTMVAGIITGTAQTGTLTTTSCSTDLTGYTIDQLIGRLLTWTSGACEGEQTDITDYAVTNGVLTYSTLTLAPGNGDTFKIT